MRADSPEGRNLSEVCSIEVSPARDTMGGSSFEWAPLVSPYTVQDGWCAQDPSGHASRVYHSCSRTANGDRRGGRWADENHSNGNIACHVTVQLHGDGEAIPRSGLDHVHVCLSFSNAIEKVLVLLK